MPKKNFDWLRRPRAKKKEPWTRRDTVIAVVGIALIVAFFLVFGYFYNRVSWEEYHKNPEESLSQGSYDYVAVYPGLANEWGPIMLDRDTKQYYGNIKPTDMESLAAEWGCTDALEKEFDIIIDPDNFEVILWLGMNGHGSSWTMTASTYGPLNGGNMRLIECNASVNDPDTLDVDVETTVIDQK